MSLILKNLHSAQEIPLNKESPLIIGRNNILGCFDKKISRSHGRITCTENGNVNLLALHTNPCFFMKNGVPPIRQLNKDEEETLNEGDYLGLLPDAFWFEIRRQIVKVKEEVESDSCKDVEIVDLKNTVETKADTSGSENVKCFTTGSSDYSKRIGSPEFEKTKRLPLSAYDTDEVQISGECSNAAGSDANIKKLKLDAGDCGGQKPGIKSNDNNKEDDRRKEEPSTSKFCTGETTEGGEKTKEASAQEDATTEPGRSKRPICHYEFNCLRKNPQHKVDFSHPGDPDYVAFENRPVCQYGKACSRRNKSHKVEFRHDGGGSPDAPLASSLRPPGSIAFSPPPTKRRREKAKRSPEPEEEGDGDGDEYDLEDPFVDDASSDEYVPTDSNSEEDFDESQEAF